MVTEKKRQKKKKNEKIPRVEVGEKLGVEDVSWKKRNLGQTKMGGSKWAQGVDLLPHG